MSTVEFKNIIEQKIKEYLEVLVKSYEAQEKLQEQKKTQEKVKAEAKTEEILKKENDCSIQHFPNSITIPESIIEQLKTKNVSGFVIKLNDIWFLPARTFKDPNGGVFVTKNTQSQTKQLVPFNNDDYINLGEEHPELKYDDGIHSTYDGIEKAGKFLGKGISNIGRKVRNITRKSVIGSALTLGLSTEDSHSPLPEAYDFGDMKELTINIKDVDHINFPINPFKSAWDTMSHEPVEKVVQVNWTNNSKNPILKGGEKKTQRTYDLTDQIRNEGLRPGDPIVFKHPITGEDMTIILPKDINNWKTEDSPLGFPNFKAPINSYLTDDIFMIHPIYLLPISVKNPYKKPIEVGQTVRLYLRGTLNNINSTIPEEKPNFILLNNQVSANIAQIVFDEEESESFSIEEIRRNLAYYIYKAPHKKQLISLYDIYSVISKNSEEKKSRKIFAEHEQFAILKKADNKNIKRRIFYRKDITPLKEDIVNIDRNSANIYIYVFDSESVFPGKNICLNKKYGVINVNGKFWELDKVKKTKEYDDLKNESDLNEACNLTFSGEKSNIYVMSLQELIRRKKHPMDKALHGEIAAAKEKTHSATVGTADPAAKSGSGGTHGAAATLKNRLAIALAIAIKNNMMKKRAQEAAEVFFKKVLEKLKNAIETQKGSGKQKKKIQKGGTQNSTRPVAQILKEMASYIKKYPNTISVLEGMVKKSEPNIKNAIKGNTELMIKLDLEESPALAPEAKEIYNYASIAELKVFDKTNNFIGTTTGTGSRPGEQSGGRALINLVNGKRRWLSGKCIQVENGIRFTEEIKYDGNEFEHNPSAASKPAPKEPVVAQEPEPVVAAPEQVVAQNINDINSNWENINMIIK